MSLFERVCRAWVNRVSFRLADDAWKDAHQPIRSFHFYEGGAL